MNNKLKDKKNKTTLRELQNILNREFVNDNRDLDKECYFMYISEESICVMYDNNIIKYDSDYYTYDEYIYDNGIIEARFDAVFCSYRDRHYSRYDAVNDHAIIAYDTLANIDITDIVAGYTKYLGGDCCPNITFKFNANGDFVKFIKTLDPIDYKKLEEYGREDILAVLYRSIMSKIRELNDTINSTSNDKMRESIKDKIWNFNNIINIIPDSAKVLAEL